MSVRVTCNNPLCGKGFMAKRSSALFCSSLCRSAAHNGKARQQAMKDINETLAPDAPEKAKGKVGGRYAKQKGERGEREVCGIITRLTGEPSKRKLGQARDSGGDVDWGPFLLEVKARQTVSMPAWQEQVRIAAHESGQVPAVVWRRKGEEFWIAVPFEEFISIFNTLRLAAMGAQDG
jgi:hypothetical protein